MAGKLGIFNILSKVHSILKIIHFFLFVVAKGYAV